MPLAQTLDPARSEVQLARFKDKCLVDPPPPGYEVHAGVLQGCPLSGALFVIVLDCYIRYTTRAMERKALLNACADDLAAVMGRASQLKVLARTLRLLQGAAALRLNWWKCVLIPLWDQ